MEPIKAIIEQSKSLHKELETIYSSEGEQLRRSLGELIEKIEKVEKDSLTAIGLRRYFSGTLSSKVSMALVRVLMTLVRIAEEIDATEKSILSGLIDLFSDVNEDEVAQENWKRTAELLSALVFSERIRLIHKASQLYFDTDQGLNDLKILVEARPVYNISADKVEGYIIRSVLTLDADESGKIEFTLSLADIDKLQSEIERVKRKINTVKRELGENRPNRVVLYGEKLR